jgi:polyphosphate kinase
LHLGTGNYHPGTARQYTDLGLLTADPVLGEDIQKNFSSMIRRRPTIHYRDVMAAPVNLHNTFARLIQEETAIQAQGGKGHIIAKMNSLVDPQIIEHLYAASQAGVKIDLLVRGICCLRPGVKGLSENIRVLSVVDRFLEHSRIYYFRANGSKKMYLSSADWMPRNFFSRYEVAFPVKDPVLKRFIREVILANSLADNVKAWGLKPDGSYERVPTPTNGRLIRSQFIFEALARDRYRNTLLEVRA